MAQDGDPHDYWYTVRIEDPVANKTADSPAQYVKAGGIPGEPERPIKALVMDTTLRGVIDGGEVATAFTNVILGVDLTRIERAIH